MVLCESRPEMIYLSILPPFIVMNCRFKGPRMVTNLMLLISFTSSPWVALGSSAGAETMCTLRPGSGPKIENKLLIHQGPLQQVKEATSIIVANALTPPGWKQRPVVERGWAWRWRYDATAMYRVASRQKKGSQMCTHIDTHTAVQFKLVVKSDALFLLQIHHSKPKKQDYTTVIIYQQAVQFWDCCHWYLYNSELVLLSTELLHYSKTQVRIKLLKQPSELNHLVSSCVVELPEFMPCEVTFIE